MRVSLVGSACSSPGSSDGCPRAMTVAGVDVVRAEPAEARRSSLEKHEPAIGSPSSSRRRQAFHARRRRRSTPRSTGAPVGRGGPEPGPLADAAPRVQAPRRSRLRGPRWTRGRVYRAASSTASIGRFAPRGRRPRPRAVDGPSRPRCRRSSPAATGACSIAAAAENGLRQALTALARQPLALPRQRRPPRPWTSPRSHAGRRCRREPALSAPGPFGWTDGSWHRPPDAKLVKLLRAPQRRGTRNSKLGGPRGRPITSPTLRARRPPAEVGALRRSGRRDHREDRSRASQGAPWT